MNQFKTNLHNNDIQKRIFWSLLGVLILATVFYAYFVNQTILNIVGREATEEKIVMLNSNIGELEFNYIALKNNITIDYAHSLGFNDVDNVKFASRKLSGQGITLNRE